MSVAEILELIQPKERASFAVIGAGNGGLAMAGFLAMRSFPVNVWNRPGPKTETLKNVGGITLEGQISGFAAPERITSKMAEAVRGVKVIMVTVPASGHRAIASEMAPYVEDGQIIVLNPGRTGGALEFRQILRESGNKSDFVVAEAGTFIYASRTLEPGRSKIFGIKRRVPIAALPATRTVEVIRLLRMAFPQFAPVENVLITSFDNMGAIFHPAPVLLNVGRVDRHEVYDHYQTGISPSVAKVLERLDAERVAVAHAFQVQARSAVEWLRDTYGVKATGLYEAIQENQAYEGIAGPQSLGTRYLHEDVPFSLVPIASLGQLAGVKTPVTRSIISLASAVTGENFWATGRTAKDMGIGAGGLREVLRLVTEGD